MMTQCRPLDGRRSGHVVRDELLRLFVVPRDHGDPRNLRVRFEGMLDVADRAYVLRSGEVVAEGSGAELLEREDLFDTFVGGGS